MKRQILEKAFAHSTELDAQKRVVEYLNVLKEQRYNTLLSPTADGCVDNTLVGELRILEKLISVFSSPTKNI